MAYRFDKLETGMGSVSVEADDEMLALIRRATALPADPPVRRVGGTKAKRGWNALRQVTRDLDHSERPAHAGVAIQRYWPLIGAVALVLLFPLKTLALATLYMVALSALLIWMLGYDRISRMTLARYHAIQVSDPRHAEVLRQRAIRICNRLDALLAKLPETWTRGLYLPDFDPEEPPEQFASDPFERLQQIARSR